jgi:hypothetical protein
MLRGHASWPIGREVWGQRAARPAVCYVHQPTTVVDGCGERDVIDCALLAVMFRESRDGR